MLDEKRHATQVAKISLVVRERVALRTVEPGERSGFLIPHHDGVAAYRGTGPADYTCGRCASLLAMGVRRGMFRTFLFACACGAVNAVE